MKPCFVTGASGFIGGKLVERLRAQGRPVRALARRALPEFEKLGVEVMHGDLHNAAALARGCAGAATVFHVAGRVGVWGPPDDFFRVNVDGTRTVLEAARAAGVTRFVYTSSPSVVYNGGDLAGVDESAPLCTEAPCAYPTSKAAAEKLVTSANAPGFATVALRPHLVWGPGDRNVVPRVLALAAKGRLKIVGRGTNRVDLTHIDNVVDAHLLAEQALTSALERQASRDGRASVPRALASHLSDDYRERDPDNLAGPADQALGRPPPGTVASGIPHSALRVPRSAAGQAYLITNGEPVVLWDWINTLLAGLGRPPVTRRVSLRTAYLVGGTLELLWRLLPLAGEPSMTRFVAKELATDHWFRIDAARRDLGYVPRVSVAEGTQQLIESLKSAES